MLTSYISSIYILNILISNMRMCPVNSVLPSIEYHLPRDLGGIQIPDTSTPVKVKATQLVTEGLHRQLLREIVSGKFAVYGLTYGNGLDNFNSISSHGMACYTSTRLLSFSLRHIRVHAIVLFLGVKWWIHDHF